MTNDPLHSEQSLGGQTGPAWPTPPPANGIARAVRGRWFMGWMVLLGSLYLLLVVGMLGGDLWHLDWGRFWLSPAF